ncbi:hypothetical protein FO470_04985 [Starkeya sp. 3C]|uniref:NlpC/P60 domain-containing protein n=1 Tax=Ancylobacter moscoviensis TaxID=2597768 RepID=A0ABY3DWR9_9HYPH|nr:hypothetical protein [Ancylobacter moscoviensis]TSJ64616.1 hypothetical protein FO470_04985 [Ancylobacter moscoviensis]
MIDRSAYLTSLIGRPWSRGYSCWHLAVEVQQALFGRNLPDVRLPDQPSWRWMIDTIEAHPERQKWRETAAAQVVGLITAPDGALVAMARADRVAHIGVWLAPERLVLHCDETFGVLAESVATLRASGWGRVRFFEPATD